jgi:biopolymer transport protein ExbD
MKAEINVTPLIDILLVLLIVFMLVAPQAPSALDASLPDASGGAVPPTASSIVLRIEKDAFTLDGLPVLTLTGLESRLRDALDAHRERTVFVRVGEGVGYARVVDAIDLARGCGAERIGLVDAPTERP